MLGEILDTRVMIKTAMKGARNDKVGTRNAALTSGPDPTVECASARSKVDGRKFQLDSADCRT